MKTLAQSRPSQHSKSFSGLMETVGSKLSDAEGDYADLEIKLHQIEEFMKKAQEKKRQAKETSKEQNEKVPSDAVRVLYDILLKQDTLTVEEYTLNSCKFKVLVIEDTEL